MSLNDCVEAICSAIISSDKYAEDCYDINSAIESNEVFNTPQAWTQLSQAAIEDFIATLISNREQLAALVAENLTASI